MSVDNSNIKMFPQGFIDLQQELLNHPELCEQLAKLEPANDYSIKLAKIAAECNVALNGDYSVQRQEEICYVLIKRLREKRKMIVTLN